MNTAGYEKDPGLRWFEYESRNRSNTAIGALAMVRGPVPTRGELLLLLETACARHPRLRSHARPPGHALLPDPSLEDHLTLARLDPTGESALVPAVENACARPLGDLTWRVRLFHGHQDGEFAVLILAHHGLADGMSLVALLQSGSSFQRGSSFQGGPSGYPVPARSRPNGADPVGWTAGRVRAVTREAAAVLAPRPGAAQPAVSVTAPGAVPRHRWTSVPLGRLTAIAHAHAASPNDVYLAALAGALAPWRQDDRPVRALVPISTRSAADTDELGNHLYGRVVTLPCHLPTARSRLEAVMEQTRRIRREQQAPDTGALLGALPTAWQGRMTGRQLSPRRVTLIASYVPSSAQRFRLAGRTVEAVRPLMFLPAGHRLAVCLAEYAGSASLGVVALPGLPAEALLAGWHGELRGLESDAAGRGVR
ncbi:WS/DGAT domain-containing protein [Kitasatospora sp. NPDC094016]|uniref:WS/DGAT domain-containing protein n=1 Tax=Kitasatospora sp. NPDC094016 TaxID=3154986 RepID=UPI003328B48A